LRLAIYNARKKGIRLSRYSVRGKKINQSNFISVAWLRENSISIVPLLSV